MVKKILKLLTVFILVMLVSGCSNMKEISYNELKSKLSNKESFILTIVQDGCSNCEAFTPKFEKILKENNIKAYKINLTNITQDENTKLTNLYNATGTPTVIFIEKGEEPLISRRIVGNEKTKVIIKKLKTAGYIKK